MKLITEILLLTFVALLHFQRGSSYLAKNTLLVQMTDYSLWEATFTGKYSNGEDIPGWLQPFGNYENRLGYGFIRTEYFEQSETSFLKAATNHRRRNPFPFFPQNATLRFGKDEWFQVEKFEIYSPMRKHVFPARLNYPPEKHLYVIVPFGFIYAGELNQINKLEVRLRALSLSNSTAAGTSSQTSLSISKTTCSTPKPSSGTSHAH